MAGDKEHVEKIAKSKFNRQRSGTETLRANCSSGYIFTSDGLSKGQSEFHHILCISALQDDVIEPNEQLDFFHKCMAVTSWDINDGSNLIGLPLKATYESAERYPLEGPLNAIFSQLPGLRNLETSSSAGAGQWGSLPDLPCHENEHSVYTDKVIEDLNNNVWTPLGENQEKCSVRGKSVRSQLRNSSRVWKQFLVGRGGQCTGAGNCWKHRNEPAFLNTWYIPFSMNPGVPRKQTPPPPLSERAQSGLTTIADWLGSFFTAVN